MVHESKGYKDKLNVMQRKCIRFCLMKNSRSSIRHEDFVHINWLPVPSRANQINASLAYKFFNGTCPVYMNNVFSPISHSAGSINQKYQKLALPSRSTEMGKRTLSYIGPSVWNPLQKSVKTCKSVNDFKHALKSQYFKELDASNKDIYIYF